MTAKFVAVVGKNFVVISRSFCQVAGFEFNFIWLNIFEPIGDSLFRQASDGNPIFGRLLPTQTTKVDPPWGFILRL